MLATQFRTEPDPRKARTVRPRPRSTATYPVTSVVWELRSAVSALNGASPNEMRHYNMCRRLCRRKIDLLFKLIQGSHIALFHQGTVTGAAGYFQATGSIVVVRRAICCGFKLRKKLQICQESLINCWYIKSAQLNLCKAPTILNVPLFPSDTGLAPSR